MIIQCNSIEERVCRTEITCPDKILWQKDSERHLGNPENGEGLTTGFHKDARTWALGCLFNWKVLDLCRDVLDSFTLTVIRYCG